MRTRELTMRVRLTAVAAVAAFLLIPATAVASVPTATTANATDITQTSVKLHGSVKPNGEQTTWHFDFGTTTAYGASTQEQGPIAAGSGTTAVATDVGGLEPGTTYHYRIVATNPSGSIPGKDRTFTTRPAVSLTASKNPVLFGSPVTLSGQVFGSAAAGVTVSLQENPYPFNGYNEVATAATDATGHFAFLRTPVTNTAYRVVAQTTPRGTSTTALVLEQDKVSLTASTSRPKRGRSVLFTGFAAPPRVSSQVYIQRLGRSGWRTVLRATQAPTTKPLSASFAVRLRKVVSGLYRAYVPIGFDHVAGASSARRITVRS
jgi:hypothetical protein